MSRMMSLYPATSRLLYPQCPAPPRQQQQQQEAPEAAPPAPYNATPNILAEQQAKTNLNQAGAANFNDWYGKLSAEQKSVFAPPAGQGGGSISMTKNGVTSTQTSDNTEGITREAALKHFNTQMLVAAHQPSPTATSLAQTSTPLPPSTPMAGAPAGVSVQGLNPTAPNPTAPAAAPASDMQPVTPYVEGYKKLAAAADDATDKRIHKYQPDAAPGTSHLLPTNYRDQLAGDRQRALLPLQQAQLTTAAARNTAQAAATTQPRPAGPVTPVQQSVIDRNKAAAAATTQPRPAGPVTPLQQSQIDRNNAAAAATTQPRPVSPEDKTLKESQAKAADALTQQRQTKSGDKPMTPAQTAADKTKRFQMAMKDYNASAAGVGYDKATGQGPWKGPKPNFNDESTWGDYGKKAAPAATQPTPSAAAPTTSPAATQNTAVDDQIIHSGQLQPKGDGTFAHPAFPDVAYKKVAGGYQRI